MKDPFATLTPEELAAVGGGQGWPQIGELIGGKIWLPPLHEIPFLKLPPAAPVSRYKFPGVRKLH